MTETVRSLTLREGDLCLELWPEIGGSIAAFELQSPAGTLPLMRRAVAPEGPTSEAREMASFPLVPFSNRIEHGLFAFGGEEVRLLPNMLPHPHPLHGHGWRSSWRVASQGPTFAELAYEHQAGEWPWAYRSSQRFELTPGKLQQEISVTNRSDRAMPAGLGFHPYFPRSAGVTLRASLQSVWLGSDECIPRELVPLPPEWDFSAGRRLSEVTLDHCFVGWAGNAVLDWPEQRTRLTISADPLLSKLVIYVPPGQDFFCVEPVSNVNDAFNLAARGVQDTGQCVLQPGQSLSARASFSVERY